MTQDEVRHMLDVMRRCILARKDMDSMDWARGRLAVETLQWLANDPVFIGDVSMELFAAEKGVDQPGGGEGLRRPRLPHLLGPRL